jgi:hypothetical protein
LSNQSARTALAQGVAAAAVLERARAVIVAASSERRRARADALRHGQDALVTGTAPGCNLGRVSTLEVITECAGSKHSVAGPCRFVFWLTSLRRCPPSRHKVVSSDAFAAGTGRVEPLAPKAIAVSVEADCPVVRPVGSVVMRPARF